MTLPEGGSGGSDLLRMAWMFHEDSAEQREGLQVTDGVASALEWRGASERCNVAPPYTASIESGFDLAASALP